MISVIVCSINPSKLSLINRMYERLLQGGPFEIIHIPDATGLAEGYNRGLARSRGSVVIFSHDDVEFLATDFRTRLLAHMAGCDVLGIVGTTRLSGAQWGHGSGMPYLYGQWAQGPYEDGGFHVFVTSVPTRRVIGMQAMDGMFLCANRDAATALRFDEQSFTGFHHYDIDFTFRAHLAGLRCAVGNDLFIIHQSLGEHDEKWKESAAQFRAKHAARLAEPFLRRWRGAYVRSFSKQDVVRVMSPPHWSP